MNSSSDATGPRTATDARPCPRSQAMPLSVNRTSHSPSESVACRCIDAPGRQRRQVLVGPPRGRQVEQELVDSVGRHHRVDLRVGHAERQLRVRPVHGRLVQDPPRPPAGGSALAPGPSGATGPAQLSAANSWFAPTASHSASPSADDHGDSASGNGRRDSACETMIAVAHRCTAPACPARSASVQPGRVVNGFADRSGTSATETAASVKPPLLRLPRRTMDYQRTSATRTGHRRPAPTLTRPNWVLMRQPGRSAVEPGQRLEHADRLVRPSPSTTPPRHEPAPRRHPLPRCPPGWRSAGSSNRRAPGAGGSGPWFQTVLTPMVASVTTRIVDDIGTNRERGRKPCPIGSAERRLRRPRAPGPPAYPPGHRRERRRTCSPGSWVTLNSICWCRATGPSARAVRPGGRGGAARHRGCLLGQHRVRLRRIGSGIRPRPETRAAHGQTVRVGKVPPTRETPPPANSKKQPRVERMTKRSTGYNAGYGGGRDALPECHSISGNVHSADGSPGWVPGEDAPG